MPDGVDAADAETVVVNGVTAWQMLHRTARVRPGATIVVLGANGGVGTTLVQLARYAGITVIGTASAAPPRCGARAGARSPVDYRDPDMYRRIRELAPDGVDAVFDHVGGPGIAESWRLLRRGGTLVSYGTAATKDDGGQLPAPVLKLFARLMAWNLLPNGRSATFYNFWAGRRRLDAFRARLREDLTTVLRLLGRRCAHRAGRRAVPAVRGRVGPGTGRVTHRRRQGRHRPRRLIAASPRSPSGRGTDRGPLSEETS